jgi:BON domain
MARSFPDLPVIPYQGGGETMSQKTDERITQDVLDELAWDPAVTIADLSVSTDRGRVILNGTAGTFGTKLEAEVAAYRVGGVTCKLRLSRYSPENKGGEDQNLFEKSA